MNEDQENIEIEKLTELLKKAPTDDGTFYGSLYDLYVLIGVVKGVDQINNGHGISLEELRKEREALYENSSRRFGWKMSWWYILKLHNYFNNYYNF